jgi:hypothetical protein
MADVRVSKRYAVPAQTMWARIGDPARIFEWHPAIEATESLDGGRRRVNTVFGGGAVTETILERGDRHHSFRIDDGPLPVANLVATLRVDDEGDQACRVEWEATFDPAGISEQEAIELNRGFFQAGLDAL